MFRINSAEKKAQRVKEVEFSKLGLTERYDIQEWVSATPEILQPELPESRQPGLLMIAKEFSGFDKVRDRVDLLAVDRSGALVVIELKRDDSGEDVHWQAIKYASYFRRVRAKRIVEMLAEHESISQEDAGIRLAEHLDQGNLDVPNSRTRIILASHRFAPHVTSAALWLNEQVGRNLFTCVQLTPFRDEDGALYLQTNTIIPVPGTESYEVDIDPVPDEAAHRGPSRQGEYDEIKRFFEKIETLAVRGLPDAMKPGKRIRYGRHRYTHIWFSREPWSSWTLCYRVELESSLRVAQVSLLYDNRRFGKAELSVLDDMEKDRVLGEHQKKYDPWPGQTYSVRLGIDCRGEALDNDFVQKVADALKHVIEATTPRIDEFFRGGIEMQSPDDSG